MRLTFTLQDIQEIGSHAAQAFVETFQYNSEEDESNSDSFKSESDSDLEDFDPNIFNCGEITPSVEKLVEENWELCHPLTEVYGKTTANVIKETLTSATEDSQCVSLQLFEHITSNEDKNLLAKCGLISYWCCCNGLKKIYPIIAEATTNLLL